jgi:hypothetical protein
MILTADVEWTVQSRRCIEAHYLGVSSIAVFQCFTCKPLYSDIVKSWLDPAALSLALWLFEGHCIKPSSSGYGIMQQMALGGMSLRELRPGVTGDV